MMFFNGFWILFPINPSSLLWQNYMNELSNGTKEKTQIRYRVTYQNNNDDKKRRSDTQFTITSNSLLPFWGNSQEAWNSVFRVACGSDQGKQTGR
jgi:hypothetical protein